MLLAPPAARTIGGLNLLLVQMGRAVALLVSRALPRIGGALEPASPAHLIVSCHIRDFLRIWIRANTSRGSARIFFVRARRWRRLRTRPGTGLVCGLHLLLFQVGRSMALRMSSALYMYT